MSLFVLCTVALAQAQAIAQPKAQLRMIGAAIGDSIVLRWAVANSEAWTRANVAGYILERTVLNSQNQVIGRAYQPVSKDTIRPWRLAVLEKRMNRKDTFALLAAQCLYGKSVKPVGGTNDLVAALKNSDDELGARFGFPLIAADMSAHAADVLGWRWVDKHVEKGNKYVYLLRCASLDGKVVSDTAAYIVKPEEYLPIQAPEPPVLVSGEKHISLVWQKQPQFSAFYPERSEDGIHFQRLTSRPYMEWVPRERANQDSLTYVDSVGINYKPFYYRLVGINPFAQQTPPSASVKGMAVDRTPPPGPDQVVGENTGQGKVRLKWVNPSVTEPLLGIIIGKTPDPGDPLVRLNEKLLPTTALTFTDENAWQFGTNFYAVGMVDTAGNVGWSSLRYVVMTDAAPPVAPLGLSGSIDTAGNVQLKWHLNPDFDLKGYNVYAANQADHQFIPLANSLITDTVFQYKINLYNLTEHIYYKVKAFDQNLKESTFSAVLELTKPDIIPPDAAVFDDYQVNANGVYLHWRTSSSKDLSSQRILRRAPKANWETITTLPKDVVAFTDTMLRSGQIWEYAVQSVDDAGLRAEPSFPVTVKIPPTPKKQGLAKLRGFWDAEQKRIRLEWESVPPAYARVLIYRSYNDSGLEMLKMLEQGIAQFEDTKATLPGTYTYALKPIYTDGSEGPLTDLVTIHKP